MSGRKRKQLNDDDESVDCPSSSAEDCPPAIENITVVVQPEPQKGKGKGKGTKEVTFRVHYKVEFTKPCCSNHKNTTRLTISSPKSCFEDGADPAILMMNKTIDKIKQHKKDKQFDGLDLCKLDFESGIGSYYMMGSRNPTVWRLLWSSAENEMNKERLASMIRSRNQVQQHKDKADRSKNKEWEKGEQYANGNIKSKAISTVANALEQCTGKSVIQATQVLSDLVSRLSQSPLFDQNEILTENQKNNNTAMSTMFENARACIEGMKGSRKVARGDRKIKNGSISKSNTSLLTGLAALFLSKDSGHGKIVCFF